MCPIVPAPDAAPPHHRRIDRPDPPKAGIGELAAGRMQRQALLTRDEPPPPLLRVPPGEGVPHRPVAPPSVMHNQLFI
jgi:Domain of unknown function (DUF5753)